MQLESIAGSVNRELAIGLVDRNRRLLEHASHHAYRFVSGSDGNEEELAVHIFVPTDWAAGDQRTGMLFFHSSQWDHGNITQFAPHAMFFASRGVVCMLAEYRLGAPNGLAPLQAMADARFAIRWARRNCHELGIDGAKLVAAGGSCGAHAAVSAAMCGAEFDDPDDHCEISCCPDSLVLFSPVLDISKKGFGLSAFADTAIARKANPFKCVRSGLPPMLLFHGGADASVPIKGSQKFAKRMKRKKNNCELVEFGGESHSFFNFNVNDQLYYATIDSTDAFLVSLGFLDPIDEN